MSDTQMDNFSLDSYLINEENNKFIKELEILQKNAKTFFKNNDVLKKQNLNNHLKNDFILNKNNEDFLFKKKNYIENSHSKEFTLNLNEWKYILQNDKRKNISYSVLKTSLRNGIDNELRPRIWSFLIDIESLKKNYVI